MALFIILVASGVRQAVEPVIFALRLFK